MHQVAELFIHRRIRPVHRCLTMSLQSLPACGSNYKHARLISTKTHQSLLGPAVMVCNSPPTGTCMKSLDLPAPKTIPLATFCVYEQGHRATGPVSKDAGCYGANLRCTLDWLAPGLCDSRFQPKSRSNNVSFPPTSTHLLICKVCHMHSFHI